MKRKLSQSYWMKAAVAAAAGAATAIVSAGSASADSAPPGVYIRGIDARGSGCQPGTVNASLSPDGRAFSLLMDHYQAQAGGANPPNGKSICNIEIDVAAPRGWQ